MVVCLEREIAQATSQRAPLYGGFPGTLFVLFLPALSLFLSSEKIQSTLYF